MYFETVLRMNIRASRKEGKYIRALMVVDLAGLSFSTLCARSTPPPCCPCALLLSKLFAQVAIYLAPCPLAFAFTKGPRISSLLSVPPPQLLRSITAAWYTGSMRTSCAEWPPLPPPTSPSSAARSSSSTPPASLSKAGTLSSEKSEISALDLTELVSSLLCPGTEKVTRTDHGCSDCCVCLCSGRCCRLRRKRRSRSWGQSTRSCRCWRSLWRGSSCRIS